jgi:regulator of sigma E protease
MVGIAQAVTIERIGFFQAVLEAGATVWWLIVLIFKYLGALIIGAAKPEIAGPIGIANMVSQAAHQGPSSFLQFVGLISVNLGVLNILPIPVLDGGNMLFFLWEGITRKRLTAKQMQIAQTVGIVILLFIFIFATQQDIFRLIKK